MSHYYLLFVLVFSFKSANTCAISSFHDTSVIVKGTKGISKITGCFEPQQGTNFQRVSFVQITNETVLVLYEDAFNNLENLVDIVLENDDVKEIHPGAFKNLPKLYLIRLKHNDLREIKEGVFNNLTVTELTLIGNNIEVIQAGAFDDMANLSIIQLSSNKISVWNNEWFKRSPKLNVLSFENNHIKRIPRRAFQHIRGVHVVNHNLNVSTTIHLDSNEIEKIEDLAFDGLETLGWLFLQKNSIEDFGLNSLGSLKQLDWLRLDHNKLKCVPERLVQIAPNVKYYLDGNPLTDECVTRFDIKSKNNNKFNMTLFGH